MTPGARSSTPGDSVEARHISEHAVQFYDDENFLCGVVANFVAEGLASGQAAVLIPMAEHVAGLKEALSERGVNVEQALEAGRIRLLDAQETLAEFMEGPILDEERCNSVLTRILADAAPGVARSKPVRVFGEMVDVLWREDNPGAALRLEALWNAALSRGPVSLLCSYALDNFSSSVHEQAFDELCSHHTRVLPTEDYLRGKDEARERAVSRLQQRARALETEVEQRKSLEQALRAALREREQAEQALRLAKEDAERANRAKSDFLAIMSHELRTPLNAIFGYEDLISQNVAGPTTPQQALYLERIRNSATQLHQLIDQVLHLARIEAGMEEVVAESVDVHEVARDTVESVEPGAAKKGLRVILEPSPMPKQILTDAGKLRQILLNLLSNAVKFTADGEIRLTVRQNHAFVHIDVADTGIGIEAGKFEEVFRPFVQVDPSPTRQYGGTGLGLSVSRNLARLLGGDIVVASTPDEGSTFTLRLPLEPRFLERSLS